MKLHDIIKIDKTNDYKLHFAKDSSRFDGCHPLDAYLTSFNGWVSWHRYPASNGVDIFNRTYILSFMDFYQKQGTSLFGGIFEVTARHHERENPSKFYDIELVEDLEGIFEAKRENTSQFFYDIELLEDYSYLIGGILVQTPSIGRTTVVNLEKYYDSIDILEILPKRILSSQVMK